MILLITYPDENTGYFFYILAKESIFLTNKKPPHKN